MKVCVHSWLLSSALANEHGQVLLLKVGKYQAFLQSVDVSIIKLLSAREVRPSVNNLV
jgi:hypothetical protein